MTTLLEIAARLQAANAIETMLLVILKATLILAAARLLLMAMPRASAATRHLVATAALVSVAAMPVMTLVLPAWHIVTAADSVPAVVAKGAAAGVETGTGTSRTIGATDAEEGATTLETAISVARATGVVPEEPLTAMSRAMTLAGATWKGVIALGLLLGTLLMLAQMLLGIAGVWFVARNAEELTHDASRKQLEDARRALGIEREVRLLRSSRISVPVIWGFFRPVLLLPADVVSWPAERLRVVLMHELAHLVRFDGITLIATRIAVAIFWFHPLAWSLDRAGRSECERACDDLVLAGGTRPSDYADHLLAIARSMPTFDPFRSVTLAMSRKTELEGRLLSILQPKVARSVFSGRGVAVACALAVAVIVPVSAMRLTAEPPDVKEVAGKAKAAKPAETSVTVTSNVEAISDYLVAKLGKFDKRADRFLSEPKDAEDWYERGFDLYRNDRFEDAAGAFRRAAALGYKPAKSLYNAACSWALLGDAGRATETLAAAIDAGWNDFEHIAKDSDFDPIRTDAAFVRLAAQGGRDVATRRVTDSMERYRALSEGKPEPRRGDISDLGKDVAHLVAGTFGHEQKPNWFGVGLDLLRLRRLDESIDAFERAIAQEQKPSTSMYNLACAWSLKGDARNGMVWLAKAVENGFSGDEKLANDPDIALLRTQTGFTELRQRAIDLEMRGCCDGGWKGDRAGWREAAEHHRGITTKYPGSGRAWFNLGYTALQARDFATAAEAFTRTIDLGYRVGTASYNMACVHALQDHRDAAFEWLDSAHAQGFALRQHMDGDEDLHSLHRDPRWEALRKETGAGDRWRWKAKKKES